jgi:mRNA interferase MazF
MKIFRNILIVIVSRQELIDSAYSILICAPVYTNYNELSTQFSFFLKEGLKHSSAVRCDELISILQSRLTDYVEAISEDKLGVLGQVLSIAVGIDGELLF